MNCGVIIEEDQEICSRRISEGDRVQCSSLVDVKDGRAGFLHDIGGAD